MTQKNNLYQELYSLMIFSRILDKTIGAHDGHWHGLEGEEAIVAGVYHGLRQTDILAPHYRGSPVAAYAKGADLRRMIAGLFSKSTGYNAGRHRGDICAPAQFNLIGLYTGSLGPPLGYATGAALAVKLDGRDDVAVAVFGDGASSRGDCHEAMNLASVQKLPIVFVCQNNQFAISTPAAHGVSGSIAARGAGFGMPGIAVDGNDVLAVHSAMQAAIAKARKGEGPTLIEAQTYRVAGHFYSDSEDYRAQAEIDHWRKKDPLDHFRKHLITHQFFTKAELETIDNDIEQNITSAFEQALKDPAPNVDQLSEEYVYAGELK